MKKLLTLLLCAPLLCASQTPKPDTTLHIPVQAYRAFLTNATKFMNEAQRLDFLIQEAAFRRRITASVDSVRKEKQK